MNELKPLVEKKKKYHHGDLKLQLLEAVRELVEEKGPDGFSIAEACRRAGVSTAAPYKHFADRSEILRGVVMLAMERMRSAMEVAAASKPAGDPMRIVELGHAYVDFAKSEPGVFRAMFALSEDHAEDAELKKAGDDTCRIVECVVAEHLGIAPEAPEARLRAYALWCFVHGHSFLSLDSKLPGDLDQIDDGMLMRLVGDAMLPVRT